MTTNLNRLAESLKQAAPDLQLEAQLREERAVIEESLRTVGEYALPGEDGRVYLITAAEEGSKSK
jgi:hypothetical protein